MSERVAALMAKAEKALASASQLLDAGDLDASVNRAYYAMFYVAEALLEREGLAFSKHSGVHAALALHFVKPGRLDRRFHRMLIEAFGRRILADYEVEASVSADQARVSLAQASEFLAAGRHLIGP